MYFLRANYKSLGQLESATRTLQLGAVFVVTLIALLPFIPERLPNIVIPVAYSVAARAIANKTQLGKSEIDASETYSRASNWKVVGASILALAAFFLVLLPIILLLDFAGFIDLDA